MDIQSKLFPHNLKFCGHLNMPPRGKKTASTRTARGPRQGRAHPVLSVLALTQQLNAKNAHCQKPGKPNECRGYRYCEPAGALRLSLKASGCQNYSEAAKKLRSSLVAAQREDTGSRPVSRLSAVEDARENLRRALRRGSEVEKTRAKRALEERLMGLSAEELTDRIARRRKVVAEPGGALLPAGQVEARRDTNVFSRVLEAVTNEGFLGFLKPSCEAIIAYGEIDQNGQYVEETTAYRHGGGGSLSLAEVREYYGRCPSVTAIEAAAAISEAVRRLVHSLDDASEFAWEADWQPRYGNPFLKEIKIEHDPEGNTTVVKFVLDCAGIEAIPPEEMSDYDGEIASDDTTELTYKQTRGGRFKLEGITRTDELEVNSFVTGQTIRALETDIRDMALPRRSTAGLGYLGDFTVWYGAPARGLRGEPDVRPYTAFEDASFSFMCPRFQTMALDRSSRDLVQSLKTQQSQRSSSSSST